MSSSIQSLCIFYLFVSCLFSSASAQNSTSEGKVTTIIAKKSIIASFVEVDISVGDDVEIVRLIEYEDPITGVIRGGRRITVATGIIDDFGLGKAQISILEVYANQVIKINDTVVLTGKQREITRFVEEPNYGDITDISEDAETVVTSFGSEDEISEGDIFLIQRTETLYDPVTSEAINTNEVNVGKIVIDTIEKNSSVAKPSNFPWHR